jgi:hypothetical protein
MKHHVLYIDRLCCLFAAQRKRNSFEHLDEIGACFGHIATADPTAAFRSLGLPYPHLEPLSGSDEPL